MSDLKGELVLPGSDVDQVDSGNEGGVENSSNDFKNERSRVANQVSEVTKNMSEKDALQKVLVILKRKVEDLVSGNEILLNNPSCDRFMLYYKMLRKKYPEVHIAEDLSATFKEMKKLWSIQKINQNIENGVRFNNTLNMYLLELAQLNGNVDFQELIDSVDPENDQILDMYIEQFRAANEGFVSQFQ